MFLEILVLVPLLALLELIERLLWLEPYIKGACCIAGGVLLVCTIATISLLIRGFRDLPCNNTPYDPNPAPRVCEIVH